MRKVGRSQSREERRVARTTGLQLLQPGEANGPVSTAPPRRRQRYTVIDAKKPSSACATTAATIVLTAIATERILDRPAHRQTATAPTIAAVMARLLV